MINKSLRKVIGTLGLTAKHALVYEALLTTGASSPLILSRVTKLNRSSLYRYLDELVVAGLVETIIAGRAQQFMATNPENLRMLITKQETKLATLKEEVPLLVSQLKNMVETKIEGTQVKYFRGVDGLRQMLWNVVSAGTPFVGLGYQNWNTSVGKNFAEKLRQKIWEMKTPTREILNEIDKDFSYTTLGKSYGDYYEHRAVPKKVLEITFDTYIYGDVFAYYYHYNGEFFGVEMHNQEIAKTERQIFEILWKVAT